MATVPSTQPASSLFGVQETELPEALACEVAWRCDSVEFRHNT